MPDQSTKVLLRCAECGIEFIRHACRVRAHPNAQQFCTVRCRAVHQSKTQKMEARFGAPSRRPVADRFWEKVDKSDPDGCWPWTGARCSAGYGRFGVRRQSGTWSRVASQVAWELTHGPIPDGLCVLHRCDNPPCCRPDHLFLGTLADNTRDMMEKGRYGVRPEHLPRGTKHHAAKLTEDNVREIRSRYEGGETQTALARVFSLSVSNVHDIVRRNIWTHV